MSKVNPLAVIVSNVLALFCCAAAYAEPITLDVSFKLTDINYNPLPGVPVRLVFGSQKDWRNPDAGIKFTTDEKGEAKVTTSVAFDTQWKKTPTNFVDSLLSTPQPRKHLMAAAALNYMNLDAVYAVDIVCLPHGDTMQDNFMVYIADESGKFTRAVEPRQYGRTRAEFKNVVFQGPGFEPWDYQLLPTADPSHWTLKFAFKKSPPPVSL